MLRREHQARQAAALALALALLAGCNPGGGAQNDSATTPATNQAVPPANAVAAASDAADNSFVIPEGNAVGRPLAEARPGTPEAAMDTVHQAVAFVQTDRPEALQPLLAPALAARLAKAGGPAFLKRWQATRVAFPDKQPAPPNGDTLAIDVTLHGAPGLPDGTPGTVTLRKRLIGSRLAWQITDVALPTQE